MSTEMSIPFEEGKLFFKVFVIEDYSETESIMLFKCHHAIADGMSLIGLLSSMQDEYRYDQLYEFAPKLSCCTTLLMWLCLPFSICQALWHILFVLNHQKTIFTAYREAGQELSGKKIGAIQDSFDVAPMKALAKKYKVTLNDVFMGVLCTTMYKYFASKGKIEKQLTLAVPLSFRRVPKTAQALDLSNDLSGLFYDLQLTDDFETSIEQIKV